MTIIMTGIRISVGKAGALSVRPGVVLSVVGVESKPTLSARVSQFLIGYSIRELTRLQLCVQMSYSTRKLK